MANIYSPTSILPFLRRRKKRNIMETTPIEKQVNILLVDDRPDNLYVLEAVLGNMGHNLVSVTSGPEALYQIDQQDFAIILLDVQMPEMDGFETAARIRRHERAWRTPIIFVTAIDRDEKRVREGYAIGATDYLFKPIEPIALRAKVATFAELFRQAHAIHQEFQTLYLTIGTLDQEIATCKRNLARALEEQSDKQAQEQQTKEQLRMRLAHELRTPLNAIYGFTGMLLMRLSGPLTLDQERQIRLIQVSAKQLLARINDTLDAMN